MKEKNEQRINEYIKSKKVNVLFGSNVGEITPTNVVLMQKDGARVEVPNDLVFIFAGGELPTALLTKAGVRLRTSEVETKAA